MNELINLYKGKLVTIILNTAPRPIGGVLESVDDDFLVINPQSSKTEWFIISINSIASIKINQSGELDEVQR